MKFPKFNKKEEEAAENVVAEVAAFWSSLGLQFPEKEISNKY